MSAEPERPCPACKHGMARAEGPVAGAADYLCRFCEVAVHVKPEGRETVSYRVAGERREFDLVGDARLRFPLPGTKLPGDVIVPVGEAARAAGHPVQLPGHPVGLPAHPVPVPVSAPVNLPDHPVALPDHPVPMPAHPVGLPAAPVELPDHPVRLPAHAITIHREAPVGLPGHQVLLPAHPVGRPGHPLGTAGHVVAITRTAAPRTVEHIVVPAEPSRFCARTPMARSVLRGSR